MSNHTTLALTQTNTALPQTATAPRRALLNVVLLATPLVTVALVLWGMAARNSYNLDAPVLHTDFLATLAGARLIHDGDGTLLYDLDAQYAAQTRLTSPYFTASNTLVHNHPPTEALLVAPLADLPPWLLFVLWDLVGALAVGLSLCLLNATLPIFRGSRPIIVLVVLLAFCSYQPLIRSFMLGQNSALVLLGLCVTYVAARRQHDTLTGLSLFLVALLKPQMLPIFLLLVLLERRWKALIVFAAAPIAFYLASMPILGAAWPLQYVRLLTAVADWQDLGVVNPANMHN
ncbi:MAG TPA: glycosyltransferase family 87 protein, partial [Chloroflexia bacterium]|nr:glycosyltransferase family 87 protein [Chloroflexia bacterium]